ncbi:MAG: hypothetical protein M3P33_03585 [bacterium]|nr:hypothetical protein [bacterium]
MSQPTSPRVEEILPPQSQQEMDEFESGNKVLNPKNYLKLIKPIAIGLGVLTLLVIVAVFASSLLNRKPGSAPGQISTSSNPSTTPVKSLKPQVVYPPEYAQLDNKIQEHSNAVKDVPETRTRLNYPPMSFEAEY